MMKTMMGLTVNSVKSLTIVIQQTGEVSAIKPFTNWRKAIEKWEKSDVHIKVIQAVLEQRIDYDKNLLDIKMTSKSR